MTVRTCDDPTCAYHGLHPQAEHTRARDITRIHQLHARGRTPQQIADITTWPLRKVHEILANHYRPLVVEESSQPDASTYASTAESETRHRTL
ncbi:hypothetical protein ACWEN6_13710 [Sphaerisporangium sp. NPDC004334]